MGGLPFVINAALKLDIGTDEKHILLNTLGELTPSHIKAIHFYNAPEDYYQQILNFPDNLIAS